MKAPLLVLLALLDASWSFQIAPTTLLDSVLQKHSGSKSRVRAGDVSLFAGNESSEEFGSPTSLFASVEEITAEAEQAVEEANRAIELADQDKVSAPAKDPPPPPAQPKPTPTPSEEKSLPAVGGFQLPTIGWLGGEQVTSNGKTSTESAVDSNPWQRAEALRKLRIDAGKASKRAAVAERKVDSLKKQLDEATTELTEKDRLVKETQSSWAWEKATLLDRVAEFTTSLQNKDAETKAATDAVKEEARERREKLEAEVTELKRSLERAEEVLTEERKGAAEMRDRISSAEDELEYEQMRFDKEKKELDRRIEQEKYKLMQVEKEKDELEKKAAEDLSTIEQVEAELRDEQRRFETERRNLEEQIEQGTMVRKMRATEMSQQYRIVREEMTNLWNKAKNDARKQERKLKNEIVEKDDMIARLRNEINETRAASDDMKQKRELMLQQKNDTVEENRKIEAELSSTLEERDGVIAFLNRHLTELKGNEKQFQQEIETLEKRLQVETTDREKIKAELSDEKLRFQEERKKMEKQIDDAAEALQEKTREMSDRFSRIRKEMNALVDSAKSDARMERAKLKDKYDAKIAERNAFISQLEDELGQANLVAAQLRAKKDDMVRQRDSAREVVRNMELQLTERDGMILDLGENVKMLQNSIAERDVTISDYESSYRQILKLSVRLTGRRVRNFPSRVRRIVRFPHGLD